MIFIILGARDQDIQNKREPCGAIRRSISQIRNDLTVFMKGPLATFDCPKRTTLPGRTDEETDEIQMNRLRRVSLNEAQARKPSNFDNIFSRFIISSKLCIKENV